MKNTALVALIASFLKIAPPFWLSNPAIQSLKHRHGIWLVGPLS
jgi:hypothetical protein